MAFAHVVKAAAQGVVAAVIAAGLSAVTEPAMNRVLVQRCTLVQAINAVNLADCLTFFLVTCPMNLLKFPFFEVTSMMLSFTALTGAARGAVTGWLFCTFMLPFTNIRFRKSMNLPIEPAHLYQAYPPTVLRDIAYGWSRSLVGGLLVGAGTLEGGRGLLLRETLPVGLTVFVACIVSAPFNEWRGYWLQDPAKMLPLREFLTPKAFVRSSFATAAVMGISLALGAHLTSGE